MTVTVTEGMIVRKMQVLATGADPIPWCSPQAAVDVVLGDSPVLSRQHCRIVYNFQTKKWQLVVEVGVQQVNSYRRSNRL